MIQIFGPLLGSVHDAKIWEMSGFIQWLEKNNYNALGDKGYTGCSHVISPHTKRKMSFSGEKI